MDWIICSPFVALTGHCPPLLLETGGHAGSCQRIPLYIICDSSFVHKLIVGLVTR